MKTQPTSIAFALALAVATLPPAAARAAKITLTPVADTAIISGGPLSNSLGTRLAIGTRFNVGSVGDQSALMKFDVAGALPAGSTIKTSNLIVTIVERDLVNDVPLNAYLYPLTSPWGEGTTDPRDRTFSPELNQWIGDLATSGHGDATWSYNSYDDSMWDTPGGDLGQLLSQEALRTDEPDGLGEDTFSDTYYPGQRRISNAVQDWLDNPQSNDGFIIVNAQPGDHTTLISSREGVAPPKLVITYIPAPEPGTLALLGLGGMMLLGRRRGRSK